MVSGEQPVHVLSLALGVWLFLSRFVWTHSEPQFANTQIVAIIYTSLAVAAIGVPNLRYAIGLVAAWLFASAWMLPRLAEATLWNNLLVSIAMLTLVVLGYRRSVSL